MLVKEAFLQPDYKQIQQSLCQNTKRCKPVYRMGSWVAMIAEDGRYSAQKDLQKYSEGSKYSLS